MRLIYLLISIPLLAGPLGCERGAEVAPQAQDGGPALTIAERGEPAATDPYPPEPELPPEALTDSGGGEETATELEWDALVPADWRPDDILAEYDVGELEDDDPRAQELMQRLEAAWKESPVVPELDGRQVKMPGFVVPIEADAERIAEFLLVPYYGACIHVPPPPANQTVHVVTANGAEYQGKLFDTVWVTGTLKVESSSSELAEAGYRIDARRVEPYE